MTIALHGFGDRAFGARQRRVSRSVKVRFAAFGDQDAEGARQLDAASLVDAAPRTIGVFEANGDGSDLLLEAAESEPEAVMHVLSEGRGLGQTFPTNVDMHTQETRRPSL